MENFAAELNQIYQEDDQDKEEKDPIDVAISFLNKIHRKASILHQNLERLPSIEDKQIREFTNELKSQAIDVFLDVDVALNEMWKSYDWLDNLERELDTYIAENSILRKKLERRQGRLSQLENEKEEMRAKVEFFRNENSEISDTKSRLLDKIYDLEKEIVAISKKYEDAHQVVKDLQAWKTQFNPQESKYEDLKREKELEKEKLILGDFAYQFKAVLSKITGMKIHTVHDIKAFLNDSRSNQTVVKTLKDIGMEKDEVIKELDNLIKAIMKI